MNSLAVHKEVLWNIRKSIQILLTGSRWLGNDFVPLLVFWLLRSEAADLLHCFHRETGLRLRHLWQQALPTTTIIIMPFIPSALDDQIKFIQRNNEVVVALNSGNLLMFLHFDMNSVWESRGGVEQCVTHRIGGREIWDANSSLTWLNNLTFLSFCLLYL